MNHDGQDGGARRLELAANLRDVRARIDAACAASARRPEEVTLVAVTKTWPASDVLHLAALGVHDIGENRDQEASPKAAAVGAAGVSVTWHFIGQLQRNKCASVVRYAGIVHSIDGVRLAAALDRAAVRAERSLDVLVQVSIDGDLARGGAVAARTGAVVPDDRELDRVLAAVAGAESVALRGLMAVAPADWAPDRAFAELAEVRARVMRHYPDASLFSAGMSGDVEQAIDYGATHVRMGSALLGNRPGLM